MFGLSRNADSDDIVEKNMLFVECLKARLDGSQRGKSFTLHYDATQGTLFEGIL